MINFLISYDSEKKEIQMGSFEGEADLSEKQFSKIGVPLKVDELNQEAIDKLKTNMNKYDLCLMDLHMPVLGGVEATKIIRKEISQDLPIIALTAAVLEEDRKEAEAAGTNDFLTKPIDLVKLAEKIIRYGKDQ